MIIIGHRGARNEAPENTLQGFRHLRALDIHHVELDLRLSQDKQLVVIHDTTVDRTCNGQGPVSQWTAADLQRLGVPTLTEVIEEWPELASIQLEVKTASQAALAHTIEALKLLIESANLHQKAIITSSDQRLLALAKTSIPHVDRGFVAERFVRAPVDVCLQFHCSHLILNHYRCTPWLVDIAHRHNLEVSCWTVNRPSRAKQLRAWGIDSLITDVPQTMLKCL